MVIDDCCESLGCKINGEHIGKNSECATYSFYFSHQMSTMEGGMITCQTIEERDIFRSMRNHGMIRGCSPEFQAEAKKGSTIDPAFLFSTVGFNARPLEVSAAIGRVQLRRLDDMVASRKWVYDLYTKDGLPDGMWTPKPEKGVEPAMFGFPLIVNGRRGKLLTMLDEAGIEHRPLVGGCLPRHPAFRTENSTRYYADYLARHGVYLPLHPQMMAIEVDYIMRVLQGFSR
jgi:CDP-6-deoxy-D-xylo-4-hexulose-3-dehydrase